jgi:hypothetical protein
VDILEEGVQLHSARVADSLRPLHELIEKKFKDLKLHAQQWRKVGEEKRKKGIKNPHLYLNDNYTYFHLFSLRNHINQNPRTLNIENKRVLPFRDGPMKEHRLTVKGR